MLATLLYHGLRRAELCALHLSDLHDRQRVRHLRMLGKGSKIRNVPLHPAATVAIAAYLDAAGHGSERAAPLFRPVSNNARGVRVIMPKGVYRVLAKYAGMVGVQDDGFGPHALRATAITNALSNGAPLGKVQEWVEHANIPTTPMYRRKSRVDDSPTFIVSY